MYIWIGCKLPADFENALRGHCLAANRHIGLNTAAFSLPQHISLKISFDTPEHEAVLEELTEFLSAQQSFQVRLGSSQRFGNILWLPAEENDTLLRLHAQLDELLENRFGIPRHEFDKAFLFHSTLFIDDRPAKLEAMAEAVRSFPLPPELQIDTFLLGVSNDGAPGSYRVVRTVKV